MKRTIISLIPILVLIAMLAFNIISPLMSILIAALGYKIFKKN